MKEIAKFDIQVVHQGTLYKVGLREANKDDTVKFQIAGRSVTPFEYTPLPADLKAVFRSLDQSSFASEKDLMKRLKSVPDVACFSVTKKVYDLATFRLVQNQTVESKHGRTTKELTYQGLRSCSSSDSANVSRIIRESKLPDSTLFEIADGIEHNDRNVALAHAVRETSRSFNLESAVEHLCENLVQNCIKSESAAEMATCLREKFVSGAYEPLYEEDDFAQTVTRDLQAVSHNRHVFVMAKPPPAAAAISSDQQQVDSHAKRIKELQASNFGFGKFLTTPAGTAYLDIRSFENPKELVGGEPLARNFAMTLMKQLVDSKPEAVILDLRNHGGGSVYMSELMLSYFLEEELPLTRFEYMVPPKGDELKSFPLEPCQTWSYQELPKEQRLLNVPLYVLISHDTFSAGEDIACHLKERQRAILIGETTGGGGDPNKLFDADEFLVAMPVGFAKVPYGPGWEGVGISPHIPVEGGQDAQVIAEQRIVHKLLLNSVLFTKPKGFSV